MPKYESFKVTNQLTSSGEAHVPNGFVFLGKSYLNNDDLEEDQEMPDKSFSGTSETRGNVSRNLVHLNNNGPILFNFTQDDRRLFLSQWAQLVNVLPTIDFYPWLTPIANWSEETQMAIANNIPIYKCLGKGLGEVTFYKVGSQTFGSKVSAGSSTIDFTTGNTCTTEQAQQRPEITYPFSGTIYAGNLVQLICETDDETGIKQTKVIPYQNGRGILYPADNYAADTDISIRFGLYRDPPYGPQSWVAVQGQPYTPDYIDPYLAPGTEPGDSAISIGIALDTFSSTDPRRRLIRYQEPTLDVNYPSLIANRQPIPILNDEPYTPWFNHPAPFTVQPESVTPGRYLSPENGSNLNWAPWPYDYAYQVDDPIPILTKGITTARIGAAYNAPAMSYGISTQVSATDELALPVISIPLFEGEEIQAGSYVYASVKGHTMKLGPTLSEYGNPYNRPVRALTPNEENLYFGPTVWDPWIDSTGAIGWTGTPGLSFSNIPDQGYPLFFGQIGSFIDALPFLNQANQGSIIVHPITTNGLNPTIGANGFLRFNPDFESANNITDPLAYLQSRATSVSGISGRCNLLQSPPEKAVPIGVVLETIKGKGKWTYTGLITNGRDIGDPELTSGGGSLLDIVTSGAPSAPTRGGTGTNLTAVWTANTITAPNLGTITTLTTTPVAAGAGYTDGDILTVTNSEAVAATHTPFWKDNNAALLYDSTGPTITLHIGGSGYSAANATTHNLSLNNLYIREDTVAGVITQIANSLSADYPTDTTRYDNGFQSNSQAIILQDGVPTNNTAIIRVETSPYSVTVEDGGTGYAPNSPNLLFESQQLGRANPEIEIIAVDAAGEINTFIIIDYGWGNETGDIILVTDGDENATFAFPELPYGEQEIILGSPSYVNGNTYAVIREGTFVIDPDLTVEIRATNERVSDFGVPTLVDFGTNALGPADDGVVFNKVFNLDSTILMKSMVTVASTGNVNVAATLDGLTIDGITLVGSNSNPPRILLKNQTTTTENGIYDVLPSPSLPTRSSDALAGSTATGARTIVTSGTTQADTIWTCLTGAAVFGDPITFTLTASTAFDHPDPWYGARRSAVRYIDITTELILHRGGSNYTTDIGIETYNLSANSLQVGFDVTTGSLTTTNKVPEAVRPPEYSFNFGRYEYGSGGTILQILDDATAPTYSTIRFTNATNLDEYEFVSNSGTSYTTGVNFFQTQRTDQTNPIVNITADANGFVRRVTMTDIGSNNQNGDLILIKQTGSDFNAVFEFNNNLAEFDFPPFIQIPNAIVPNDAEAWKRYEDVMTRAENLLDKQILIELRPNMYFNGLENIYPTATANSLTPPQDLPSY